MEGCSASKKSEILTCAAVWMSLEDILLSEISQSQKDKYVSFHLYAVSRVVKDWLLGAGGGENGKLMFNGYGVSVFRILKKFWSLVVQHCECT